MSQATTWNTITAGPANMSQVSARVSDSLNALLSMHSGSSRPAYAVAQTQWLKIVSSTQWEVYLYTGTADILLGTYNPVAGTFTGNSTILGFATSAVARNDVSPLSLVNGRLTLVSGTNTECQIQIKGRNSGNGDEGLISWYNGVGGAFQFGLLSQQNTALRILDSTATEALKFLATGDIESKLWAKLSEQIIPKGTIIVGPWLSAPPGFLACSGSLVSRATYAALWAQAQAIGQVVTDATWSGSGYFGAFSSGDGSTTFRIPLFDQYFIRGLKDNAGGGSFFVGLWQDSDNKSHIHSITDPGHLHQFNATLAGINHNAASAGTTAHAALDVTQATDTRSTGITINSTGSSEARPKNVSQLACIKV